ncbi:12710_t:CDS:2 [Ambispora gerdemannii]|uniref:12710_t:CDS:1 n=1 Tax=Ambispora gerdemannii TaxID=144530 RepID=A0A9N8WP65_9GLOM|nr:12710_t:CDS:2 [Ambispora gerdemannii]
MAEIDNSLSNLFASGEALYNSIENSGLASSDIKYQEDVRRALGCFSKSAFLESLRNQTLSIWKMRQIITIDSVLNRFLLVEAYLGNLTVKLIEGERLDILKKAKQYHEQFLRNVELHEILTKEDRNYMEEQSSDFTKNAAKTREIKIVRYKRKIALEKEVKELETLGEMIDESTRRKHVLKLIELFIQKSFDELTSIKQETELLEKMQMTQDQGTEQKKTSELYQADSRLKNTNGPLLSKEGRPLQPFIITNQREAIQQQVFRPGWRLPTMTVDEYLQQEMNRGNIISGGGKIPEKKEIDDNDEGAIDAATYKAREMDEFKDTNPRGWGNRMGKG